MGRDKLTLVGAGCVLTVHSLWNIGAQENKKTGWRIFVCLLGLVFLLVCLVFLLLFFLSPAHFLMRQQANPV